MTGSLTRYQKTYRRSSIQFYWRTTNKDKRNEWAICHQNKSSPLAPARLLHSLPIEALSKSDRCDTVWVIIDRLCKCSHFIPPKDPFNAKYLVGVFIHEVICLHWTLDPLFQIEAKFLLESFGWSSISCKAQNQDGFLISPNFLLPDRWLTKNWVIVHVLLLKNQIHGVNGFLEQSLVTTPSVMYASKPLHSRFFMEKTFWQSS